MSEAASATGIAGSFGSEGGFKTGNAVEGEWLGFNS